MFGYIFNFFYSFTNLQCTKQIDNTKIHVIKNHAWTDHFCKRFSENEPYTNMEMKNLLSKLNDASYIIDVGAHVGDTGLYLALHLQKYLPQKSIDVIMIEPDETKVDFIEKMITHNKLTNCVVFNCGVSDKECTGSLAINKEFPDDTTVVEDDSSIIPIGTIDDLCIDVNVSLMHIDVEGMEYKCLEGSKAVLKNVQYIVIELNDICDRQKERAFLKENDFKQIENENMLKEYNNELYVKTENLT